MSKNEKEEIEGAEAAKPEKDGAPRGFTYRLLLKDGAHGRRGQIVTLTFAEAEALKKGEARIPTTEEIALGVI